MTSKLNLTRVKRRLRSFVTSQPLIYFPIARMMSIGKPLCSETRLVIEGFPRSGNTYAETAFRFVNGRDLPMAHHCHAAAQVIAAAKRHVPCLVVIRNPIDACGSLLMHMNQRLTPRDALSEYLQFHEAIQSVRADFVLAKFETITQDFGRVIRAINSRFATSFEIYEKTPENERAVFAMMDEIGTERHHADPQRVEDYSPSRGQAELQKRDAQKAQTRDRFRDKDLATCLTKCEAIYQRFVNDADA